VVPDHPHVADGDDPPRIGRGPPRHQRDVNPWEGGQCGDGAPSLPWHHHVLGPRGDRSERAVDVQHDDRGRSAKPRIELRKEREEGKRHRACLARSSSIEAARARIASSQSKIVDR
jgi:hypothetical protein